MKPLLKNPMYRFLMVLTVSSTLGFQAWRTLFNNFAHDVAYMSGQQVGIIQSVREIPGFLALLAVYVMLLLREHRLSAFSVLALGLGVSATGFFPTFGGLLATTLLMSFGFHYFETTNQSLTIQYFDKDTSPRVFGNLRGLASGANIAAGLVIFAVEPFLSFKGMYLLLGGVVVAAAVWALFADPTDKDLAPQRRRMVFRRKYSLFYFLTFMAGARRQIFVAFAVFLLVQRHGFTVREITALFVVNNVINWFLSPMIGRAIVRFGERPVLSLEYASLLAVFLAYALVDNRWVVAGLYVLDHVFFNFAIAIRTYFQKIGDPRDVAPSMAVGFTINHIAAVVLPAVGGMLWMVDYRIVFFLGAAMALVSLAAVQRIPRLAQETVVVGGAAGPKEKS